MILIVLFFLFITQDILFFILRLNVLYNYPIFLPFESVYIHTMIVILFFRSMYREGRQMSFMTIIKFIIVNNLFVLNINIFLLDIRKSFFFSSIGNLNVQTCILNKIKMVYRCLRIQLLEFKIILSYI